MRTISRTVKLTQPVIDRAVRERAKGQKLFLRDEPNPGFYLAVNARTASSYYDFRPMSRPANGKQLPTRHLRLGELRLMDLPEARAAYLKARAVVVTGGDPAQAAVVERAERVRERERGRPLSAYVERYLEWYDGRPVKDRTKRDERRQLRDAVGLSGAADLPPPVFGRAHAMRVLEHPARAAKRRKLYLSLRGLLNHLVDHEVIPANPLAQVDRRRRPKAPPPRTRVLSLGEVGRVWRAAAEIKPAYSEEACAALWTRLVRFALLIPARINEIGSMRWGHVDPVQAVWTQPGKLTKNGDEHTLPLPPAALALLEEQRAGRRVKPDDPVWTGPRNGRPFNSWAGLIGHARAASGVLGWSWHDLRRTAVTNLAERGVAESVEDALLNHRQSATRGGVLGVYQRARRRPERRDALALWEGLVLAAAWRPESATAKGGLYRRTDSAIQGPAAWSCPG